MIKIHYDKQIFNIQKFGGISRYFAELIKGINNTPGFASVPKKYYSENAHLRSNGLTYLDRLRYSFRFKGKGRLENHLVRREIEKLNKIFIKGDFDIFHPTYYTPSSIHLLPKSKRFVLTVYDMIHELYYDSHLNIEHTETLNKKTLIPKADHIIAISQNTKNDILRFYPSMDSHKITVSHLGSSLIVNEADGRSSLPFSYILFVGHRGFYKNFTWLLQSIAGFLRKNAITLLCAGAGNFNIQEQELIAKEGVNNNVQFVDFNSDRELVALYKGALCFIFPSLFEGFGIPILEAFSCGCPVVVPKSSCFPEIAGESALYYEPGSQDNLIQQLERIINDPQLSASLRNSGLDRLKLFSWENTVRDHVKVYGSLCAG